MSNQASEDILTYGVDRGIPGGDFATLSIKKGSTLFTFTGDEAVAIIDVIRTEKLKLLAEVRERVVGAKNDLYFKNEIPQTLPEYMDDVVKVREQLRVEQREVLTKLEAEL